MMLVEWTLTGSLLPQEQQSLVYGELQLSAQSCGFLSRKQAVCINYQELLNPMGRQTNTEL